MFIHFCCTCFSDNFLNKKIFFKKMIFQIRIKSYPKNMSINISPNMFVHFCCTCFSDNFLSEFEKSENKKIFFKKMIFQIRIKSYPKNMSTIFYQTCLYIFVVHVFRITFYPNLENQKIKKYFSKR